jgi:hypothetical protein
MRKEVVDLVTEVFAPSRATSVVEAQEALVFQVRAARLPVEVMQLHPAQQGVLAAVLLLAAATLRRLALPEVLAARLAAATLHLQVLQEVLAAVLLAAVTLLLPALLEVLALQEVPATVLLAAKPLLLAQQEAATPDYAHQVVQRQVLHLLL